MASNQGTPDSSGIVFGPTKSGKKYYSLYSHRGNHPNKSQWSPSVPPFDEYQIFSSSDDQDWKCTRGHYWGVLDGGKLDYLLNPSKWSGFDQELFAVLKEIVVGEQKRGVKYVRERNLIPSANYFEEYLSDDRHQRDRYMDRFMSFSASANLLFFDPDNGMEVASTPPGSKGSSKYVYWEEIQTISPESFSILIYQHFPREERQASAIASGAEVIYSNDQGVRKFGEGHIRVADVIGIESQLEIEELSQGKGNS